MRDQRLQATRRRARRGFSVAHNQCVRLEDSKSSEQHGHLQFGCAHAAGPPFPLRVLAAGTDGLLDWEIVDLILQTSKVGTDSILLAKSLILRFGSLGAVVRATVHDLCAVAGIGLSEAFALKAVGSVATGLIKSRLREGPVLRDWKSLKAYLIAVLSYQETEQVRTLFLDRGGFLLADELHNRGTVNNVGIYPREIAKRALELNSSVVIIAHNHPSGNPEPGEADVAVTIQVMGALKAVDVALHDHIVMGKGSLVSFRKRGIIPFGHIDLGAPYHHRKGTRYF